MLARVPTSIQNGRCILRDLVFRYDIVGTSCIYRYRCPPPLPRCVSFPMAAATQELKNSIQVKLEQSGEYDRCAAHRPRAFATHTT